MPTVNLKSVSKVYHWLLNDQCHLCGQPCLRHSLCAACRADLPWLHRPLCRCGLPRTPGPCPHCPGLGAVSEVRPLMAYQWPMDRLILAYKHHGDLVAERLLQSLFEDHLPAPPDAVVAVPLAAWRSCRRGFNQSTRLAAHVARRLDRPLLTPLRRRGGTPQQGLGRAGRAHNLDNRIHCVRRLDGLALLLVDDVVTTGATAAHCASALRRAGARDVSVLCLARTGPRG